MVYKENIVVCLKTDGKILRERGEYVTLPFGSEYTILIKNLDSRKAVISIEIDGKDVLDGDRLIVDANSDIELEGFKKGNKVTNRFKFIKKTNKISEYRGDRIDDGFIRVEATFEEKYKYMIDSEKYNKIVEKYYYPFWYYYPTYTSNCKDVQWSYTVNCNVENSNIRSFAVTEDKIYKDEGITVKGNDDSNQKFVNGYISTLEKESHVVILRLRGTDLKENKIKTPIFVNTKKKCEICGTISKSTVKYCSNCGNYLG